MPEGGFDMYAAAIAKKALRIRPRFLWREVGGQNRRFRPGGWSLAAAPVCETESGEGLEKKKIKAARNVPQKTRVLRFWKGCPKWMKITIPFLIPS